MPAVSRPSFLSFQSGNHGSARQHCHDGARRGVTNFRTFDAVHLENRTIAKTTLTYAFVDRVVRIFGDEKEMSSHFVNALVEASPNLVVELFAYLLDYHAVEDRRLSSQTYGGRLAGSQSLTDELRPFFEAQYAKQIDFGENPTVRDAHYLHLMGGMSVGSRLKVKAARELLSGSPDGGAFQTPLATGHKFNGWADLFLVTPHEGLVDSYLSADGKICSAYWTVVYHDFGADEGGRSYGTELDVQLLYPTSLKVTFRAKAAFYREDGFARDVSKLWLWTQYSF